MDKEYLLFLPIEPCLIGDTFEPGVPLPLHCTLLHWFRVRERFTFSAVHESLSTVAHAGFAENPLSPLRKMRLVSEKASLFGPNNDIPVHELQWSEGLRLLHERVLYALGAQVIHCEPRWIGSGWHPHVTTTDGREFAPGMSHAPTQFVCLERDERKARKVVSFYIIPPQEPH